MNKVTITALQTQPLSKRQKQFNSIVESIEKLKSEKENIAQNIVSIKAIYSKQILPLVHKNVETTIQMIFALDRALDNYSIAKRYQNAVSEFIKSTIIQIMPMAKMLCDNDKVNSIKSLFEEHDDQSYDEYLLKINQQYQDDEDTLIYEQEEYEYMHSKEKTQADSNGRDRKQDSKADKRNVTATKIKKDIKAIYTNLAKQLHPDLEQDETLIPQKNDLMKAVTQAYSNNDLHELLRIQMQVKDLRTSSLSNTPDSIMDSYIKVLKTQKNQLRASIASMITETPIYADFVDNTGQISTININKEIKSLKKNSIFLGELIVQTKSEKAFNQLAEVLYKERY